MSERQATEARAIIALVQPMAQGMAHLNVEGRIMLLSGLLAQEICTLPPAERAPELERVLDELPMILRATEGGMRQALVADARDGGSDG